MMHVELMFPSLYLKSADLHGRDVSLTISRVVIEELTRQGGSKENKPVVYFEETDAKARAANKEPKRLVLNKTNARAIAALHDNETDNWRGKRITLYTARVTFGRQTVDAIRVRDQAPPPKQGSNQNGDGPDPAEDFANAGSGYEYTD